MRKNQAFYFIHHFPVETITLFPHRANKHWPSACQQKALCLGFMWLHLKMDTAAAICVIKKSSFKASASQVADTDDSETARGEQAIR